MNRSSNLIVDGAGLIAVITLALIVRFHAITVPSVWYDEAFSLLLAKETPWQIWTITARDVHPPLYYVFLHYWMLLFGNSVLSVRSLSVLADVGTLLLCVKLMSLVATRRATWIAALLLALLPISVRYSQEVRMYTWVSFWLMGATVALVCWVKSSDQKRFPTLYVLLMTAAFYTHYFAAFCVLVHWLYWWRARSGGQSTAIPVRAWVLANSAIVVLYLPWIPHFIRQVVQAKGNEWISPLTWQAVLDLVWQFTVMTGSVPISSWWCVMPALLIVVCAALALVKDRIECRHNVLLVGYFFVPAIMLLLVALFIPVFIPRYILFAAVGLPLILAVVLDSWWQRWRVLAAVVLTISVIGEVQGLLGYYTERAGTDFRMDKVLAGINQNLRPDDEIVIDSLYWYLPFMYYNTSGIQPRVHVSLFTNALWGYPDQGGWALIPQRMKWIVFNKVSELRPNARRIWWVTETALAEDTKGFPKQWKKTLRLDGGEVEVYLLIPDATPPSPEAGVQTVVTRQPPH